MNIKISCFKQWWSKKEKDLISGNDRLFDSTFSLMFQGLIWSSRSSYNSQSPKKRLGITSKQGHAYVLEQSPMFNKVKACTAYLCCDSLLHMILSQRLFALISSVSNYNRQKITVTYRNSWHTLWGIFCTDFC